MRPMTANTAPDLTPYRRLLIFGGSFDPPHLAHLEVPRRAAEVLDADVVVYVPAGRAPHKLDRKQTPPHHRLAMLRLALEGAAGLPRVPGAVIWPGEVLRSGDGQPSYTVETLEELRRVCHPDAERRLLIGSDQVHIFEQWKDWQRVIELAEPAVVLRPPDRMDTLPEPWGDRVVLDEPRHESSTASRARLIAGAADERLPPAVARYIQEHGLYGAG